MSGEARCRAGQREREEPTKNCHQVGYGLLSGGVWCSLCPWSCILMSAKDRDELLRLLVEAR